MKPKWMDQAQRSQSHPLRHGIAIRRRRPRAKPKWMDEAERSQSPPSPPWRSHRQPALPHSPRRSSDSVCGTLKSLPVKGHFTIAPASMPFTSTTWLDWRRGFSTKPGRPGIGFPQGTSPAGVATGAGLSCSSAIEIGAELVAGAATGTKLTQRRGDGSPVRPPRRGGCSVPEIDRHHERTPRVRANHQVPSHRASHIHDTLRIRVRRLHVPGHGHNRVCYHGQSAPVRRAGIW